VRKLTRAVEQSPAMVVITDTEGRIEYVNPKFTSLTGYTSDEVLARTRDSSSRASSRASSTSSSGKRSLPAENGTANSTTARRTASCSGSCPQYRRSGTGRQHTHFVAVNEDTTERKLLEEERERLISELDAFSTRWRMT